MLPVSVFSELVWQSVLLYWYNVYNIFFPSPTIVIRLVITPKQKKTKKEKKENSGGFGLEK